MLLSLVVFVSTQVLAPSADFERAQCIVDVAGVVVCGFGCAESASGQVRCAQEPGGTCTDDVDGQVVCSKPTGIGVRLPLVPAQCLEGADGQVACGYACVVDGAGKAHCANTADGACAVSPGGLARCTKLNLVKRTVLLVDPVRPGCGRETDGGVVCGYDCVKASTGKVRCASTPDGACGQSTDGVVTCTNFDPEKRLYVGTPIQSECLTGAAGHATCGYGCVRDKTGKAFCSSSPFGACAVRSDGHARCFPK